MKKPGKPLKKQENLEKKQENLENKHENPAKTSGNLGYLGVYLGWGYFLEVFGGHLELFIQGF